MLEALCYYIDIKIFSFYKNDAFFEKYLAKSRVGARLFFWKGYSKGETQIRAYMKRDVLIISLSGKTTLFAESTLQNGESGGAVLSEGIA